ncbi:hypothetical protein, partial [Rhabdochromatium marinum]|uniref:hypothetical protein n=1 Tax=Rhabdochromatium marinum TaxID=48729 RepID=UPI001A92A683
MKNTSLAKKLLWLKILTIKEQKKIQSALKAKGAIGYISSAALLRWANQRPEAWRSRHAAYLCIECVWSAVFSDPGDFFAWLS